MALYLHHSFFQLTQQLGVVRQLAQRHRGGSDGAHQSTNSINILFQFFSGLLFLGDLCDFSLPKNNVEV